MLQRLQDPAAISGNAVARSDAMTNSLLIPVGASEQARAPSNISSVLWALSSPRERDALIASNAIVRIGPAVANGDVVKVPLYLNDSAAMFDQRIVEAVADRLQLDGKARTDFIAKYSGTGIEYKGLTGDRAFKELYADTLTGAIQARTITVGVDGLMANGEVFKQSRSPGENVADAVRRELGGYWSFAGGDDAKRALDMINALSGDEKRLAIANLASDGTLTRLAGAMTTDRTFTGLISGAMTTDEQSIAMKGLVRDLGGSELASLSTAFAGTPGSFGGFEAVKRFSNAVGSTASNDAKRDFVLASIGKMTDAPKFMQSGGSRREFDGDIDALAAARVLATLDPSLPQTRQAFLKLADNPNEFAGLLNASMERTTVLPRPGFETRETGYKSDCEPSTFETILNSTTALSSSNKSETDQLRAQVFEQGIRIMGDPKFSPVNARLATPMVALASSSPNAILQNAVAGSDGVTKANTFRPLLEQLIKSGNYEAIGMLKDKLIQEDYVGDPERKNTIFRAGVFTGSVLSAMDNVKADADVRAKVAEALTKNALRLVGGTAAGIVSDWSPLILKEVSDKNFRTVEKSTRKQLEGVVDPTRPDAARSQMQALDDYRLGVDIGRSSPKP